ncbi:MAG: hypothetical protein FWH10_02950 [Oscillospiraceae bacterium]|nr:hypothetical protein [Oscillospiraceae bacterium]
MALTINFNNSADENAAYIHLKNLYPASRIIKIDKDFDELLEEAEDEYLLELAEQRMRNGGMVISQAQMRKKLGISQKDIDETEADFD